MPFVSITRLRIRSWRFMPPFFWHTMRSLGQARRAPGFRAGSLLRDRRRVFWTLTLWDSSQSMRDYMTNGSHRIAMPHLLDWCDEASVAHFEQAHDTLPAWSDANARMRAVGRPSKLRHPSPQHSALAYVDPRLSQSVPIIAKSGSNLR